MCKHTKSLKKSHLACLNNSNIEVIPYDCQLHDKSAIKKLLSYSLYYTDEEKVNNSFQLYSSGNRHLFIYVHNNKYIGVIGFNEFGMILHISVDPEYRCKGIGKQMIESILLKFSTVSAETDIEGIEFYKACGFRIESLGEIYH